MSNNVAPQGGLIPGSVIMLTALQSNVLYVMVRGTTPNTVEMIPALATNGSFLPGVENRILRFTLGSVGEYVTFMISPGEYLSYNTGGIFTIANTPPVIFFDQANFQPIERPSVLLSGIEYIPYGGESVSVRIMVNIDGTPTEVLLIPTPVNIYMTCTTPTGNDVVSNPLTSLQLVQCSYPPSPTPSYCTPQRNAWTDQVSCFNGNRFNYCTAGTYCSSNCYSECQSPTDVCTYQGGQQYTCRSVISEPQPIPFVPVIVPAPSVEDSSWFTILVLLIIFFIIGLLLLAYYQSQPATVYTSSETVAYHNHPVTHSAPHTNTSPWMSLE